MGQCECEEVSLLVLQLNDSQQGRTLHVLTMAMRSCGSN